MAYTLFPLTFLSTVTGRWSAAVYAPEQFMTLCAITWLPTRCFAGKGAAVYPEAVGASRCRLLHPYHFPLFGVLEQYVVIDRWFLPVVKQHGVNEHGLQIGGVWFHL